MILTGIGFIFLDMVEREFMNTDRRYRLIKVKCPETKELFVFRVPKDIEVPELEPKELIDIRFKLSYRGKTPLPLVRGINKRMENVACLQTTQS